MSTETKTTDGKTTSLVLSDKERRVLRFTLENMIKFASKRVDHNFVPEPGKVNTWEERIEVCMGLLARLPAHGVRDARPVRERDFREEATVEYTNPSLARNHWR